MPEEIRQDEDVYKTITIMNILADWGAKGEQIINIVGLPENIKPRMLRRFHDNTAFPESPVIEKSIEHILGIADALRTTYPGNARMAVQWMQTKHRRFAQKTPLETISQPGTSGLTHVRAELDCTFAWDLTGSK